MIRHSKWFLAAVLLCFTAAAAAAQVGGGVARAVSGSAGSGLGAGARDDSYERGAQALDSRQWEQAVRYFGEVPKDGPRADGALYWKAYAQNKLGRRAEALAVLDELKKSHSGSRWLNEARALELEIRQASGRPVSPENVTDEDLKLMAISGLMHSDPERAVPLLEKVLAGANPPKVKERALFVLSQSGSPRAREIVAEAARGKLNPDLQLKAVEYLGLFGGKESRQALASIYGSGDTRVKRAILRSFMLSGAREQVLAAAKEEKTPELRREAIHLLGLMGAQAEIWELYKTESAAEVKKEILQALFLSGNVERMSELARNEKDPQLRREAIHKLGLMGGRTSEALVAIYGGESDKSVRKAVIQALFLQGNAKALVEIARKESDPELKKDAVQRLSLMKSKDAADFMMELLNK